METSAPKRRKTSPTEAVPTHGSAAGSTTPTRRGPGGRLPVRSQRIAQRPSPRPLPPRPEEEEEPIDPFRGRVLRRSPPPPGVLPATSAEEPELPPTPTQKGISDPASVHTSPAGIHNSSPSKRARRSKALAEKLKSSPLKQPPLRPPELAGPPRKAPPQPVLTQPRGKAAEAQAEETAAQETRAAAEDPKDEEALAPHPSRQVKEFDPDAEKKATRDALLAEVARLAGEIDFVSGENERLRRLQQGGKPPREPWSAKEKNDLLGFLRRHIPPPAHKSSSSSKEGTEELLLAALNPISFLPFSRADQATPDFLTKPPSQPGEGDGEEEKDAPISHYPIPLTADEELPYLQAFTPLTFTSHVSVLPRDGPDDAKPLQQRHVISVASSPPGLFAARIQMTVNTKNLSVAELSVPQLDPAAARELRPFVESIVNGQGGRSNNNNSNNSALTRNVSVVAWAMGEWLRLATRRARFWCAVERDLTSREGVAKCVKQMRRGGGGGKNRQKRRGSDADTDTDKDDDETEMAAGKKKKKKARFSRADLARYLGKTSFDLDLAGPGPGGAGEVPSIRVQWKIELDWTGEARSRIGLFVAAPARWHGRDKGRSLAGIPAMFDKLVSRRKGKEKEEPMYALKTVVALLAGDGKS